MRRRFLLLALSGSGFLLCLGCRTSLPHEVAAPIKAVGKMEPATLTLKPGATGEFKFSLVITGEDRFFYTTDITWSLVGTPSYSVGTIASAPGQMSGQNNFALGQFQAVSTLPAGVDRVTFKIMATYLTGTPAEVTTTADVTLDVNAPAATATEAVPAEAPHE